MNIIQASYAGFFVANAYKKNSKPIQKTTDRLLMERYEIKPVDDIGLPAKNKPLLKDGEGQYVDIYV
jgi:hypothetical protein